MEYSKIRELCTSRGISIPQLAEKIGVSKGLYTAIKNETLTVSTLEKIAEALEVPVCTFFESGYSKVSIPIKTLESIISTARNATSLIRNDGDDFSDLQNSIAKAIIAYLETKVNLGKTNNELVETLMSDQKFLELENLLKQSANKLDQMRLVRDELKSIEDSLRIHDNVLRGLIPSGLLLELFE